MTFCWLRLIQPAKQMRNSWSAFTPPSFTNRRWQTRSSARSGPRPPGRARQVFGHYEEQLSFAHPGAAAFVNRPLGSQSIHVPRARRGPLVRRREERSSLGCDSWLRQPRGAEGRKPGLESHRPPFLKNAGEVDQAPLRLNKRTNSRISAGRWLAVNSLREKRLGDTGGDNGTNRRVIKFGGTWAQV